MHQIARGLARFRSKGWPVLYPYVSQKETFDRGRLADKVPALKGAIAGVAGPESANNAGAQTSFIPMLTLGIPSNPVMALMIGAMVKQGIQPGPVVVAEQPALFWGLIASMWIGNLFLIILNLPLIGLWVRVISVPYHYLYPAILIFSAIGVFSISNSTFDVYLMAIFGVLGYLFRKLNCEPAPMLLGFILGPMMEEQLRRAMLLAKGDPSVFILRPISAVMLVFAAVLLVVRPQRMTAGQNSRR